MMEGAGYETAVLTVPSTPPHLHLHQYTLLYVEEIADSSIHYKLRLTDCGQRTNTKYVHLIYISLDTGTRQALSKIYLLLSSQTKMFVDKVGTELPKWLYPALGHNPTFLHI